MSKVKIYTTSYCPYCLKAKALLTKKAVAFEEILVANDELKEELIKKSFGRRTVPQIFIGDLHIGGFDDLYALEKEGKLDPILKANQG